MDVMTHINSLPDAYMAQIFEKLRRKERLKIERVCKKWRNVGKDLSWSNHRVFDNMIYRSWPEERVMEIKTFFERCGRYFHHVTLDGWSPEVALSFIRMAPNVLHLEFAPNDECLKELAQIVPNLKSLKLKNSFRSDQRVSNYDVGLIECLKAMKRLEYLSMSLYSYPYKNALFGLYSFVQFPINLKYLALDSVENAGQVLPWVAKECHNLRVLRLSCSVNENTFQAISQMKTLAYLSIRTYNKPIPCDFGYIFEALTELRALSVGKLNEKEMTTISLYCKKLEHISLSLDEISPEEHASLLRLATLPNLCSLVLHAYHYTNEQTTEFVKRLIDNGKLKHIKTKILRGSSLEFDVMYEMLRRCKNIQSIDLRFGRISLDFYSKIRQIVDEIDEEERQHCENPEKNHPILQVECGSGLAKNISHEYKWLQFVHPISSIEGVWKASMEKWQYGWLSAGKPEWARV